MAQRVANTSSRGYIINRFAFSIVQLRDGNLFTRLRRWILFAGESSRCFLHSTAFKSFSKLLRGIKYKFTHLEKIFSFLIDSNSVYVTYLGVYYCLWKGMIKNKI